MRTIQRRSKQQPKYDGWDLLENPVPGDVVGALEELGLEILKVVDNSEAVVKCPAHMERLGKEDRHPSFSVNIDSGASNCFSCGFGSTYFADLVEYVTSMNRAEVLAWIRQRGGIERARKILFKDDLQIVEREQEVLTEADLALCVPPPPDQCAARHFTQEDAATYGVLWDPITSRWITPIRDPETFELWGWQEKSKRVFLNRPDNVKKSSTLFGIDTLRDYGGDTAVLVESPLDCVRILNATGEPFTTAGFGKGITDTQLRILAKNYDRLIVALDNDAAGIKIAKQLQKHWITRAMCVYFYDYADSEGKDPGDQSDDEICFGIDNAVPAILARF